MAIDPHSAVGLYGARMARHEGVVPADVPIVSLACAHPAKFPAAVAQAVGAEPALPSHLADLMTRDEKFDSIENDLATIQSHIQQVRRTA